MSTAAQVTSDEPSDSADATDATADGTPRSRLPREVVWLLAFQACNQFNFTVALGAPLVLMARFLGASEFQIGLMSGMAPFLVCLQIFTTNLVERVGYRQLMLAGWGTRSFMLLLLTPLPLLVGHAPTQLLVWGTMIPIFLFNAIRGFASGAWLPWLHEVLPAKLRGYYFGIEQTVMNVSAFLTMQGCGFFLRENPPPWKYSALFVVAWIMGMLSVMFLRRMPSRRDPHVQHQHRGLRDLLRTARDVWARKNFRRATRFIAMYTLAVSAIPVFLVLFIKEQLAWGESTVMRLQSISPIGVLLTAVYFGRLTDRVGSRPLLRLADLGQFGMMAYWIACAFGVITPGFWPMATTYLIWGVCSAAHAVSQTRLILAASPEKEYMTVAVAVFQVVVAITGGGAPVIMGKLLDWLKEAGKGHSGDILSHPYLFVFGLCLAIGLLSQLMLNRVEESDALPAHKVLAQMFYDWPMRVIGNLPFIERRKGR